MAQTDRFMIAPINTGMQTDLKPWLIPDDAFSSLINAYVFRGRVRKRFGTTLMNQSVASGVAQQYSRFRVLLGNTNSMTGNFTATVPGTINSSFFGQMFSVGDDMFTVPAVGNPVTMLTTSATATGTFDTTSGALSIVGETISTPVYFYPGLPVMGLVTYEDAEINSEPVFGFDTNFAYTYSTGSTAAWVRSSAESAESPGSSVWTGNDTNFFWGYTYRGVLSSAYLLFVTNFNVADRLRYWDGNAWNFLSPVLNSTYRLLTSRIVLPFKNRLVCLNTVENNETGGNSVVTSNMTTGNWTYTIPAYSYIPGQSFVCGTTVYTITATTPYVVVSSIPTNANPPSATFVPATGVITVTGNGNNANLPVYFFNNTTSSQQAYVNRCRFSQNGSPVAGNAWLDNVAGLGGFTDAPTKEQIVSAGFLKDRLIVYFESSTWELAYTGNQIEPFVWQQINTELGAEATFSAVPFDKNLIAVGNVGVHSCNGSNVERIDGNIPDSVFEISNDNEGVFRVYGIRDYFVEMVYWAFPSETGEAVYPDRVLVYNYKNGAWAFNYDTITAFGYYQKQTNLTWESCALTWEEMLMQWDSGTLQSQFRDIIAGNQQGFVSIVETEIPRNAPSLIVSNMSLSGSLLQLTIVNHNLTATSSIQEADGAYIIIENGLVNTATFPSVTIAPLAINGTIYPVYQVVDANNILIAVDPSTINGTYVGGATLARVSNLNIVTKQYNFYVQEGRDAAINKVDFLVDKTVNGEVTVDYYVSSSDESSLQDAVSGALMGTCVLETSPYPLLPLENSQSRLWHPMYPQANGECIQLNIYMKDAFDLIDSQIRNPDIAFSDFQLNAMTFYTQKTGRLQ